MDEYLPMFLAEGREHVQELNLAVVQIEETPDDQAVVDEIFRIAHSLKGMSATMGFANMAALTPGGYLVVGTSERVSDPKGLGLTSPYHFIYRKS